MASNVLREIYNQDASEYERLSNLDLNKQSTAAAFQVDNVKRTARSKQKISKHESDRRKTSTF